MIDWIAHLVWVQVPWWAWAIIGLVLAGGVWKWFGWQGLLGLAIGLAALFGYRAGYRDADGNKPPVVPIEDFEQPIAPKPKKKRKTLQDLLNGK